MKINLSPHFDHILAGWVNCGQRNIGAIHELPLSLDFLIRERLLLWQTLRYRQGDGWERRIRGQIFSSNN
jgi:hypothetical protein